MAKLLKTFVRNTLWSGQDNLMALDDPYYVIRDLLKDQNVTGILDAGASNGRVARKLLRLFPDAKAYAFEPNPEYREILQTVSREDERILPQVYALSDKSGDVQLNVTENIGSTSLFQPNQRFSNSHPTESSLKETVAIKAITIDEWVRKNGKPTLELMKFDIQASELAALQGATTTLKSSTLLIYTEIFFNPLYKNGAIFSDIDLFLRDFGFVLYNIYKPMADKNGLLNQANAIYVHSKKLGF